MKNTKHGMSHSRIYREWSGMKSRCYCKSHNKYYRYGGSGIKVCKEWMDFIPFYEWAISNGYKDNLTLDRINYSRNYEPDNCRWVDYTVQNNNRRMNVSVEINGVTKTVTQWSREYGISPITVFARIKKGWNHIDAITIPSNGYNGKAIRIGNEVKSISKWAEKYNIPRSLIYSRLKRGFSYEEAITTPAGKGVKH